MLPLLMTLIGEQLAIQQCLGAGGWDYSHSRCLRAIGPDAPPGYAPFHARHRFLLWGTAVSLPVSWLVTWVATRGSRAARR